MRKTLFAVTVLLLSLSLPVNADESDMGGIFKAITQANPIEYQFKMKEFIDAAKTKSIDKMLQLTSPITRKQYGDDSLRALYEKDYIKLFQWFPKMSEGGTNSYVNDASGAEGWFIEKTFSNDDGQSALIYFVVLKENGILYVSSVGVTKQ